VVVYARDKTHFSCAEPGHPKTGKIDPVNRAHKARDHCPLENAMSDARVTRRQLLQLFAAGSTASLAPPLQAQGGAKPIAFEVWKDPSCGCCGDWIAHMQAHGFQATVYDTGNAAARARLGLPQRYGSCHTALINGYAVEGHVPASDVKRLLREKPQALGLAVPGMPIGTPGMDGPAYGGRRDAYDTLLVLRDGGSRVFQRHA
jgi:hypothetical protein